VKQKAKRKGRNPATGTNMMSTSCIALKKTFLIGLRLFDFIRKYFFRFKVMKTDISP
jgi:hypothetical protein